MKKRKSSRAPVLVAIISFILLASLAFLFAGSPINSGEAREETLPEISSPYHAHADFLVIINGQEVDFNNPDYDVADERIHLHLLNYKGDKVLHIESRSAELGDFFASLGMIFNSTCFAAEEEFCNNSTHTLKFFVNSIANDGYDTYRPKDLDRILISYGTDSPSAIDEQINSVTELACVFSQTCPAPPEAGDKVIYN